MAKRTFFDQWYRLANLRVGLRASVSVRQTRYRDDVWYVYHEPVFNGFFRARPDTHRLISQITPDLTLAEIWQNTVTAAPEIAPGQEEFFDLIASLYRSNLLFVEGPVSETRLLDRSLRKKSKPVMAQVSELFFLRIPLWDPDPFLTRWQRVIDALFSRPALWAAGVLMAVALVVFATNATRAFAQSQSILQANNLLSLFLATFVTHLFHEMAHAALCKRFGGQVRSMGLMLLMFTPLPYADVTSSWLMRNAWHRAAIGAAGMFSDLIFCALATLYWAYSPPGAGNELAMNIMFTTAVYTFVFNLNPLMRFDGYYILSDLIAIPNLHQVAKAQFDALWRGAILQEPVKVDQQVSPRRRAFLVGFFVTSFIYRNMVSFGIVLFLADQYFGLGLIGAVAIAYNSFIKPVAGAARTVINPHFRARHKRPLRRIGWGVAAVLAVLVFLPLPDYRRLQGVVEAEQKSVLHAAIDGAITELAVKPGQSVAAGQVLMQIENPDLVAEQIETKAKLQGARARLTQAVSQGGQNTAAIQRDVQALTATLADIARRQAALTVTAPQAGLWVPPDGRDWQRGMWLTRGAALGAVVDQTHLRFRGILPQEAAYGLGAIAADAASVRVVGDIATRRDVAALRVIPYSSKDLPSGALTPLGGGDISVSRQNPDKVEAVERFFLVDARLADAGLAGAVMAPAADGRSAWMRMRLPARPLMAQWIDRMSQFLQQRYKL